MAKRQAKTVSETVRQAIEKSGLTHYRIGKDTGIPSIVLDRFISGKREHLRSDTIDKLCVYFGLELVPKR